MSLFTSTADFKESVPQIHLNFPWEKELKPLTDQSAKIYVVNLIGEELYQELVSQVAGQSLTADNISLLEHLKPAVAYYTYMEMTTSHAVHMSSMGLQQSISNDGTSQPANNYLRNDAREQAANRADWFLDQTMEFLESQVLADNTKFPLWQSSSVYQDFFELFIWQTDQLNKWVRSIRSHRALFTFRHNLRWVQEREIKPLLGEDLYNDLFSKIKARPTTPLSPEDSKLIETIQPYLAIQGILEAIPENRVEISQGGIHFRTYDGPLANARQQANNEAIRHIMSELSGKSEGALATLKKFLVEKKDDYPLYTAPEIPSTETASSRHLWEGRGGIHV